MPEMINAFLLFQKTIFYLHFLQHKVDKSFLITSKWFFWNGYKIHLEIAWHLCSNIVAIQ